MADRIHEAIARSLVEFGYPGTTAEMVADTAAAMERGDKTMPHGIVGMMARSQLEEFA